jgi:sugar phosphate isomerase/epimerase
MPFPIYSRRGALAGLGASVGALLCGKAPQSSAAPVKKPEVPEYITPWSPPEDRKRDLAPGKTAVRLASWSARTTLDYPPKKGMTITEMVKNIRDQGYTAGNANTPRYTRNKWMDASDAEVRELREALRKYDVAFFDLHTTGSNIHSDLAEREKCNRYTVEACHAAERVGAAMVTTHVGTAGGVRPMSPHRDNWTLETWKLGVRIMKQICRDSSGVKVPLGVEATNMTIMNNPRAHLRLIEEVGDPRLKVCLDPVNMIHLGNYFRNTELIEECFELLGEYIIAAHAKDTWILPDQMSAYITEVPPGEGILDYETYLVRLSRLKWPRTLLIEHIPDEKYPTAKAYIETAAKKVGVKIYG